MLCGVTGDPVVVEVPVISFHEFFVPRGVMMNPYTCYWAAFTIAMLAYLLGWSDIYPALSTSLLSFLMITLVAHAGLSFFWSRHIKEVRHPVITPLNPIHITLVIYVLWTLDFVYEGGIPLFKIIFNLPYDYKTFGVPSLHVFTVTFASFFTVYLFGLFITTREKIYLLLYGINLIAALLIYSRAMLIFNMAASTFIALLNGYSLNWKKISLGAVGAMFLFYVFGVLGTLRVSADVHSRYDSKIFLDIGGATSDFRNSRIPPEFFWSYVYLSSPLANLQQNINTFNVPRFTAAQVANHIQNEMLPDFISKRLNRLFRTERALENDIPKKPFNVSTVYARSFSYHGWSGMILMALFVLICPLVYIKLVPSNQYTLAGVATLNTMYLFLFYDNTLRFTGLWLQLLYPFVLPLAGKAMTIFQKATA